ncbi:MAG TPA: DUF1080 domain-containing protein [Pirellulales bacterium]
MLRLLLFALLVCGLLAPKVDAADDEPWGLSLLARDSLVGWDAGPDRPEGWTVKDGVLHGEGNSTPLVGAWTFGDYEMELAWRGSHGARLSVGVLREDNGEIYGPGGTYVFAGGPVQQIRTKRTGARWEFFDEGWDKPPHGGYEMQGASPLDRARLAIRLSVEGGWAEITSLRIKEPAGKPMFNGRDLAGWWTPGNLASWSVIDGNVVCINQQGDYLRSEKEYGNFTLSLEYKLAAGGNSGIGIRTPRLAWPSTEGMEIQLLDEPADAPLTGHSAMSIYGNVGPLGRADRSERWNRVVVRAEGYMLTAWMNGELRQQANTFWMPELKHRFLGGWIGLQDHGARTEFRNVRVLEAPAGLGLDTWYRPRRQQGSEIVANRLMNLAELSREGTSAVVRNNADDSATRGADDVCNQAGRDDAQETAVAEIHGPGAVVAMTVPSEDARLRFYFDGADKPAINCPVAELSKHVPTLTEDKSPLLVYVPFQESLMITTSGSAVGTTIEYLPFDAETLVEPLAGPEATMARGLLPAVSYRCQQHGHGVLRQHDRLLKQSSEKLAAEPGQRVELLKIEGLGIVE